MFAKRMEEWRTRHLRRRPPQQAEKISINEVIRLLKEAAKERQLAENNEAYQEAGRPRPRVPIRERIQRQVRRAEEILQEMDRRGRRVRSRRKTTVIHCTSRLFWRLMKFTRVWYSLGLGPIVGRLILLLTTMGRKSGLPRITPLQYEEIAGVFYVASARGQEADWFRNILANPHVEVQVKAKRFHGVAEPVTDVARVADFLELRLRRHPQMMGAMLRFAGLSTKPNRVQLEQYATKIALVAIQCRENGPRRETMQTIKDPTATI